MQCHLVFLQVVLSRCACRRRNVSTETTYKSAKTKETMEIPGLDSTSHCRSGSCKCNLNFRMIDHDIEHLFKVLEIGLNSFNKPSQSDRSPRLSAIIPCLIFYKAAIITMWPFLNIAYYKFIRHI